MTIYVCYMLELCMIICVYDYVCVHSSRYVVVCESVCVCIYICVSMYVYVCIYMLELCTVIFFYNRVEDLENVLTSSACLSALGLRTVF